MLIPNKGIVINYRVHFLLPVGCHKSSPAEFDPGPIHYEHFLPACPPLLPEME